MNIVQSKHYSKEQRIVSALGKIDQLLLNVSLNAQSQQDIDDIFDLAKNIILDYYLCKLENPNFTMIVVEQYNHIFVTKIGDKNCNISLTDMQNNLNSIKQVIGDGNKIYDVDPIKKHKVTNFLLKVQHFDTIYKFSSDYFNQTFIFNAEYKSNTDIITQCLKRIPVGLENIGATCYMNATLQSFLNDPNTFDYFLFAKHKQFNQKKN